jgi:hypothetical protein
MTARRVSLNDASGTRVVAEAEHSPWRNDEKASRVTKGPPRYTEAIKEPKSRELEGC